MKRAALALMLIAAPAMAQEPASGELATLARDVVSLDLPHALQLAHARNLDLEEAKARVKQGSGVVSGALGAALPGIAVGVDAMRLDGALPGAAGAYQVGRFERVSPFALVSWIMRPGQVVFDILAARRNLSALRHDAEFTGRRVDHDIAQAFYALALAQAHIIASSERVEESRELLRLSAAREASGLGLTLDTQMAREGAARAQMDQIKALNAYYAASLRLAGLLDLDPAVLLVPAQGALPEPPSAEEPALDTLTAAALAHRADLAAIRQQVGVSDAAGAAAILAAVGPQISASAMAADPIPTGKVSDTMFRLPSANASLSLTLSASVIGKAQSAAASRALARIAVRRRLEDLRKEVASARQEMIAAQKAIPLARERLVASQSALTLARAGLQAGTAILHPVLIAQANVQEARSAYADNLARYWSARNDLDLATGGR
ncbi:TolC family protein [Novosphingobium sediminicola]|uniref:Outer membrane protein TolC n=1 Tax=Novosphingobium sediminicola TaxID=563162 RepID=A0A7W6G4N0_9SPHN|nr:TolC family protein [Novosphingobium sediminicola]MBB3953829.1 outer membrane protein TolC [Novosphingobium sediminicola]